MHKNYVIVLLALENLIFLSIWALFGSYKASQAKRGWEFDILVKLLN